MYDKRLDAMIATTELGSFSKAAKALGYTIPALANQVNGLEQELGITVAELADRRVLVPQRGNAYADSARDEIAERAPGVEFVEFPFYTMEIFDRCAMGGEVLLSKDIWRGIHPLLATVDVNWSRTIPYCLYYPKNPAPATLKFVEAAQQLLEEDAGA